MMEGESITFDVELRNDHERDAVASFMREWGCEVEVHPTRPRIRVTVSQQCMSNADTAAI